MENIEEYKKRWQDYRMDAIKGKYRNIIEIISTKQEDANIENISKEMQQSKT